MEKLPRLYIDMDGVLCDFTAQIRKTSGMSKERWMQQSKEDMWRVVIEDKKFWSDMPWNPQGKIMWNFIKKYNPHILSAYLEKVYDPNCIPGKYAWCRKNIGLSGGRVNLVRRKDKQNYAMVAGQPAILIDDYEKNTSQFTQKGGIGITFKSAGQVISQLKKLGF
jgi:hypothetical protein